MRFLDLETTGLDPFAPDAAILMLGYADNDGRPRVHHLADLHPDDWQDRLKAVMADCPPVVGHNVKFDLKWLRRFGVKVEAEADTMLIAQMVDENRPSLGLKSLMAEEMGGDWTWTETWDAHNPQGMARYLVKDVIATRKLYHREAPQLTPQQAELMTKIIIPALNLLVGVELRGIYMRIEDVNALEKQVRQLITQVDDKLGARVPSSAPMAVKWGNTNFQRWFLFEHLHLRPQRLGKPTKAYPQGNPSMAADVLQAYHHPVTDLLIERARLQKILTGFILPYARQLAPVDQRLPRRRRLYTTFNLAGARTGRLSAGKADNGVWVASYRQPVGINIQQVPKDSMVKPLFTAPKGYVFMEADYSQLELRVAAVIAQEPTMLGLYERGADIHTWMVKQLLHKDHDITELERRTAKAVNFGFLYGMRAKHFGELARNSYGVEVTLEEAERFREHYFRSFPTLQAWHARQIDLARRQGYVQTLFGRRRHLPDIDSSEFSLSSQAERQAINAPVQGSGSDICLWAFVRLMSTPRAPDWYCIGLVHDALLFYVRKPIARDVALMVKKEMERPLKGFNCPLVADVTWGAHWGDHEWSLS